MIQDNEQTLAREKKKMEELEATRSQVQQEINVQSSRLETIQAQLATKKLFTDEVLQSKLPAEVEETRQSRIMIYLLLMR